jgi:hypothetical protein
MHTVKFVEQDALIWLVAWCLTPHSTIFQLYIGGWLPLSSNEIVTYKYNNDLKKRYFNNFTIHLYRATKTLKNICYVYYIVLVLDVVYVLFHKGQRISKGQSKMDNPEKMTPRLSWPLWNICVTNDHGYVPLVVNTSRSFPRSWHITGFVTRLTWRVSLVEQELLTLPEHMSSPPVFSGVRVTRSLVLYVCFVDRCLSFCTFSFGHCVICSSSIYGFWLPLWYFKTLLTQDEEKQNKTHNTILGITLHISLFFFLNNQV